eukprot:TRINITY_DN1758_c0_g1_i2.p1 TRINITY_DN1758_c0_g1~~TRINITY_DN1758_c0_g1_i2.p1  ORF type:complete len:529 (+),score=101.74 TRINITY_DN1758_c0_g1_i2:122-1708(+)
MEEHCSINVKDVSPAQAELPDVPAPIVNTAFMRELRQILTDAKFITNDDETRVRHGHGQTVHEMFDLRFGRLQRIPDLVVYPLCHADVEGIVQLARKHDICLIPYGGGTNVSDALVCPKDEKRMIVSVSMQEMNRLLWVDSDNMIARVEAGMLGKELEEELAKFGVCTGHEPDSNEFSSVGGWVATRASGMKRNKYGNIEDIVQSIRVVTARGTLDVGHDAPRTSTGPDLSHLILGSEGTLGIVTEVTMRVLPLPEKRMYGSLAFPNLACGVACLREVALHRAQPASLRLVDNTQFQFGQALKPAAASYTQAVLDAIKKIYVTKWKGFKVDEMTVATIVYEGSAGEVARQQREIESIAARHHAIPAGPENGERGYKLTYAIAYLRDLGMHYRFMAESFETCVPWGQVYDCIRTVKQVITDAARDAGVTEKPFVSARVSVVYDTGACVYFYFGFVFTGLPDPCRTYSLIEVAARNAILAHGGSLSHHHGVGKLRKKWLPEVVGEQGMHLLKDIKTSIDPSNIFGNKNLT